MYHVEYATVFGKYDSSTDSKEFFGNLSMFATSRWSKYSLPGENLYNQCSLITHHEAHPQHKGIKGLTL